MIHGNDYIKLTKEYLRNLEYYKVAVSNLKQDAQDMSEQLKEISPRIAAYASTIKAGGDLTETETSAEARIETRDKIRECAYEAEMLQHHINKIERCIASLPMEEKTVIQMYYVQRKTYEEMMSICHISYSTCRRRISKGVKSIAMMLFGCRADPMIQFAF